MRNCHKLSIRFYGGLYYRSNRRTPSKLLTLPAIIVPTTVLYIGGQSRLFASTENG